MPLNVCGSIVLARQVNVGHASLNGDNTLSHNGEMPRQPRASAQGPRDSMCDNIIVFESSSCVSELSLFFRFHNAPLRAFELLLTRSFFSYPFCSRSSARRRHLHSLPYISSLAGLKIGWTIHSLRRTSRQSLQQPQLRRCISATEPWPLWPSLSPRLAMVT